MGFLERIQTFATGKTSQQRKSDKLARSIANREIQKAAFEERVKQAL